MIHPSIAQNCMVVFLLCDLTQLAIYGSQKFDCHKWLTVLVDEVRKTVQFRGMFVRIYFDNIFLRICIFFVNGYKRFSKTNSTDPRQRVPLILLAQCLHQSEGYSRNVTRTSSLKWKQADFKIQEEDFYITTECFSAVCTAGCSVLWWWISWLL